MRSDLGRLVRGIERWRKRRLLEVSAALEALADQLGPQIASSAGGDAATNNLKSILIASHDFQAG